ncbi:MAG: Ig-like domain-containing protein [Planctomycetota bacterium]|nr:Ig-like domain-containing protein [Planctomycetota bacterium]
MTRQFNFTIEKPTRLAESSPANGEEMVSLTRETIIRFDGQVDPATVTPDTFYLIANGERLPGRIRVSSTERFATFFYDTPLPPSTEVRIIANGDEIIGRDGLPLDADNNGEPGGLLQADFRTLPLTFIPGTRIFGYIYDSYNRNEDGSDIPVVGATISLDANPNVFAVTNDEGFFELGLQDLNNDTIADGLPAPEFFVHIDGSTATNAPADTAYATLGKPFHTVPGQREQLNMAGTPFDIYLPPMSMGDIVDLNVDSDTEVGFGAGAQDQIRAMFADDPEKAQMVIDNLQVTYPAGSAQDENGNPAIRATIIPVEPDRLPAPLPPGSDPRLVVSIQAGTDAGFNLAGGSTNFDEPAPITFPNLDALAPGEEVSLVSFDHDKGAWVAVGVMTVSVDGSRIVSNPGQGILAPGWHIINRFFDIFAGTKGCSVGTDALDFFGDFSALTLTPLLLVDALAGEGKKPVRTPFSKAASIAITLKEFHDSGTLDEAKFIDFVSGEVLDVAKDLLPQARDQAFVDALQTVKAGADALNTAKEQWKQSNDSFRRILESIDCNVFPLTEAILDVSDFTTSAKNRISDAADGLWESVSGAVTLSNLVKLLPFTGSVGPSPEGEDVIVDEAAIRQQLLIASSYYERAAAAFGSAGFGSVDETIAFQRNAVNRVLADASTIDALAKQYGSDTGGSFYTVKNSSGGIVSQGRTNGAGSWSARVRERSSFSVQYYNPSSGLSGNATFQSGRGGGRTSITNSIASLELTRDQIGDGTLDPDGDGLGPIAEQAIGTSPTLADSDGDGISDSAEIEQGLDPLGGRSFPTGVIASLAIRGEAREVVLTGSTTDSTVLTAYVASGSHGLAVIDASQFDRPTILGQLDLVGDAQDVAVDAVSSVAIVASGAGGLHFVDVTDQMMPKRVRTASVDATQVEMLDGVAYVAAGARVLGYDPVSGDLISTLIVPGSGDITGLTHEGNFLYAMDVDRKLHVLEVSRFRIEKRGEVTLPQGGGKLSVNNGVVYAAAINSYSRGGFATVDVTDPASPVVISGSDVVSPFVGPGTAVAANGSGLGLLVGSQNGQHFVDITDLSDAENTNNLLTRFNLPASPQNVAIASGIGYVANGTGGLIVVNYVPFDNLGQAPVVTAVGPAGDNVQEGSFVPIRVNVTDDVQVRDVELLVDGRVVARDVSAPFDLRAVAPALSSGATSVSFQVRASDTGGNAGLSEVLTYTLTPDITPPEIVGSSPTDSGAGFQVSAVTLRFDEPINTTRLALGGFALTNLGANFRVGGGDDTPVALDRIESLSPQRVVVYTKNPLPEGRYRLTGNASVLADVAGNQVNAPVGITFTSFEFDEQNAVAWISDTDGDWNQPGNWSTGEVPGPNDTVILDRKLANPKITLSSGNIRIRSLIAREEFVMNGGSLTVTEASQVDARFEIGGSAALAVDGPRALFVANGDTKIDGGSFFATAGGQLSLPSAFVYSNSVDDVWRSEGAGSLLSLPNLTGITNGSGRNSDMTIAAAAGGRIDLSGVTQIVDPNSGDTRDRGVFVSANGPGSAIDLSLLASFTDADADERSAITASNFGLVTLNATQTVLVNVTTSESNNGMIIGTLGLLGAEQRSTTDAVLSNTLDASGLDSIVAAASARLGLADGSLLGDITFRIADLEGAYLGLATPSEILIDRDAAGYGWFIDDSPLQDEEYGSDGLANADSRSVDRYDLLSVVMHELGHLLGLRHGEGLEEVLHLGERQLISHGALDELFSKGAW